MIRRGLKDRTEIECVYAEVGQIVEVLDNAHQVAALEAMRGWWSLPGFQIVWFLDAGALGKPIGKNLIKNGILHPFRGNDSGLCGLGGHNLRPFLHALFSWLRSMATNAPVSSSLLPTRSQGTVP